MSDIFISFSSEDTEFAKKLSETIKVRTGFTTWLYTEQLRPGDRWGPAIDQAIEECAALVVVMTPAAAQSQYVTYEWAYADGLGRRVMTIYLEETDLHRKLKDHYQYIDFRTTHRWDELIDHLQEFVGTGARYKLSAPRGASDTLREAAQKLSSTDPRERKNAIGTLSQIVGVQREHAADILAQAVEHSTVADAQVDAAFALANTYKDKRATPKLLEILGIPNHDKLLDAIRALGELRDVDAIPGLCRVLKAQHLTTQQTAARVGDIGSEGAVPCLLKALKSSDSSLRRDAAFALGQIGGEEAIMSLIQVMNDTSEKSDFRGKIALWLGSVKRRGETQHIVQPALIKAVNDIHQPADVRRSATEALGNYPSDEVIEALIRFSRDGKDSAVREAACESLGKIKDERAVGELINRLEDTASGVFKPNRIYQSPPRVCDAAARALERIGTPEALEALENWRSRQA